MKDSARIDTAKEIFIKTWAGVMQGKPASNIITKELKGRRYIGSSDRRTITSIIWNVFRNMAKIKYTLVQIGKDESAENIFDASFTDFSLYDLPDFARLECPPFMLADFKGKEADLMAMQSEAGVTLRVNLSKTSLDKVIADFALEGIAAARLPFADTGIRLEKRCNLEACVCFKKGLVTPQDEGSQIISAVITQAALNMYQGKPLKVLDLCAGAGGKTLFLLDSLRGKAHITATDIAANRLSELRKRAATMGFADFQTAVLTETYQPFLTERTEYFDMVIVDAPCSGTGTWARNPDAKWRTHQTDLEQYQIMQYDILHKAAKFVKSNGMLVYITCSLRAKENEAQVQTFLKENKNFTAAKVKSFCTSLKKPDDFNGLDNDDFYIHPALWHTDGFFAAVFTKK